jgi:uncharacterized spore protein YtfJ
MTDQSSNLDRAATRTTENLATVFGPASPEAVFSAPEHLNDELVITAASWERAGGFGFGGGGGTDAAGRPEGGGGGGGGGTSVGRPVAVITVGAEGIRVEPVIDLTKLAVTVLLSAVGVWRALR